MAVSGRKVLTDFSVTMSRGSGEDFDLICQPCDRDDIRLPAFGSCRDCKEHLCESCFSHHKRATPSRHHILLDKQVMPQTQQFSTSAHSGQSYDLTKPCPKHTNEMIKFYCHDHRALLCSVCVTLDHTSTGCHVNYIPDISQQSLNSKEYSDILKSMEALTKTCQQITTDMKQMTAQSITSLGDVLAEIKKFRHEINLRLDELEKTAEDAAKTVQLENDTRLQTAEKICNDAIIAMKTSSDAIKQLDTTKQADRLFMEMKLAEQTVKDNEEKLYMLQSPDDVTEYHFQPNTAISTCLKDVKSIGTLKYNATKPQTYPQASTLKSLRFSHLGAINAKTSHDFSRCWITGMVHVMKSKLILTDHSNKLIKMVDINSYSINDHLQLDTRPWQITTVTRDQFAVTLPGEETIQFISVFSHKLSLEHTLGVHGDCHGITCYQGKLALTFISSPKLEIIDLKGRVLTIVTTDYSGEDIFIKPYCVTSNSKAIYVADAGKHKVFMLNWRGELTGSYGGMGEPGGITVLETGSIFVNDYIGNMQHISGDLTKGNVVLKDLDRPYAVYWCATNSLLYISFCTGNNKDDNSIQMFKMT